jgi:hypothetical protein
VCEPRVEGQLLVVCLTHDIKEKKLLCVACYVYNYVSRVREQLQVAPNIGQKSPKMQVTYN